MYLVLNPFQTSLVYPFQIKENLFCPITNENASKSAKMERRQSFKFLNGGKEMGEICWVGVNLASSSLIHLKESSHCKDIYNKIIYEKKCTLKDDFCTGSNVVHMF